MVEMTFQWLSQVMYAISEQTLLSQHGQKLEAKSKEHLEILRQLYLLVLELH